MREDFLLRNATTTVFCVRFGFNEDPDPAILVNADTDPDPGF
jgi:hypothetical protein